MMYLILQILICLVIAFLLGLLIGFLTGKMFAGSVEIEPSGIQQERDAAKKEATEAHGLLSAANAKAQSSATEVGALTAALATRTAERDAAQAAGSGDANFEQLTLKHDVLVQRLQEAENAVSDYRDRCNQLRTTIAESTSDEHALTGAQARNTELEGVIAGLRTDLAAFAPVDPDNLKKIEGIGPKIQGLLNHNGILTFRQLAAADVQDLRTYVMQGGKHMRVHDPKTWSEQAGLAAEGRWDELKKRQRELHAGKD